MTLIYNSSFTAIDFESAGIARGQTDVPVQVGMAKWSLENGHAEQFDSYIQSDKKISWQARKIHGITDDDIADAPKLIMLWPHFKTFLSGHIIVAHGKGTEQRFLRAFPAHNFEPWVDTLLLYRAAFPELNKHSLGYLCDHFELSKKIEERVQARKWHDALFDSVASLFLLEHLIHTFDLKQKPTDCLFKPDTSIWHQLRR